jgi:hypothetical protein
MVTCPLLVIRMVVLLMVSVILRSGATATPAQYEYHKRRCDGNSEIKTA